MFSGDTVRVILAWLLFDKNKSRKSGPLGHAVPVLCYPLIVLCFSLVVIQLVNWFYERVLFICFLWIIYHSKWIKTFMGNCNLNNITAHINRTDALGKMVQNRDVSFFLHYFLYLKFIIGNLTSLVLTFLLILVFIFKNITFVYSIPSYSCAKTSVYFLSNINTL